MPSLDWEQIKRSSISVNLKTLQGVSLLHIDQGLYQLGQDEFARINWPTLRESDDGRYFASHFYWAPTVSAARRVALEDASFDDLITKTPPDCLLLEPGCLSYGSIIAKCKAGSFGPYAATTYGPYLSRSLDDRRRRCIGRRIDVGPYLSYFFRSCEDDPVERTFAVEIDLRGIRWDMAGQ